MSIQVPLLVLTADESRSCLHSSRTRRVHGLTFNDDRYYEFMCFDVPKEFGVPDEIRDMTRSLEMVET